MHKSIHAAQLADTPYMGTLQVHVTSSAGFSPVRGAAVTITAGGAPEEIVERLITDESGQTQPIQLPAPDPSCSQEPDRPRPYSDYDIEITAPGYKPVRITGSQIFPNEESLQPVSMTPLETASPEEAAKIAIPEHTLYGAYPARIPEAGSKAEAESGGAAPGRVVIPEYIVVHDGAPEDPKAPDHCVRYRDYIKNVASSEIYPTWPKSAICANILAIQSFTLNRIHTEWYRSKGYPFTVTSSTAYDHKFTYGRNIYSNIDRLVDSIFANYLSRPGLRQPVFTGCCDGRRMTCQGLSRWGSKYLGDQGYSVIEIIQYYYGNDMCIYSAPAISGVPVSWPGYDLSIGSSGTKVRRLQEQLDRIAQSYPAIPRITADGIYGERTAGAVRMFQRIFNLPASGITDFPTWYRISGVYAAVSRAAGPGTWD